METRTQRPQRRMSADERREEILDAAMHEFALKGLHGTSTETIAQRVGVSQPYLFRLFGTKKELFLAACKRNTERIRETFRVAAESAPDDALEAMGQAYARLLVERERLLLQMHAFAACADPEVEQAVRDRFGELYRFVEGISGASEQEVQEFFAYGMLLSVAAAMNLPAVMDQESWIQRCLHMD